MPVVKSSNKLHSLLPKLNSVARRSQITQQHAAVLLHNGNAVSWGINSIKGKRTCHAECDAIHKYLINCGSLGYVRERCSILWSQKERYQKCASKHQA